MFQLFFRYKIMKQCWDDDGDARPTFAELVQSTSRILGDARQSIKRKSRSSEASSTNHKSSYPYQNSNGDDEEHR